MVYQWKAGSRHKVSADVAAAVCEELESKNSLNAETLVEVSRPEDAPLHSEFEWDDSVAAEKYRNEQARYVIRSLEVVVHDNIVTRKFFNVEVNTHGGPEAEDSAYSPAPKSNYTSLDVLTKTENGREALLDMALKELNWFRRKYESLQKLSQIFSDIDALLEAKGEK